MVSPFPGRPSAGILDTVSCRFLEIDPKAWVGVEKTAASSDPKHHIGAVRTEDFVFTSPRLY